MVFVDILLPVFLLIGAGALFSRTLRPDLESLTLFALYASTPALVFSALVKHPVPAPALARLVGVMLAYTVALWALAEGIGLVLGLKGDLRRAFLLATVPMNVGNYGLPLVRFAFGQESEPFSVLVFVIFNIPLATWAIWMAAGGSLRSFAGVRDTLRIPILHATVVAFVVSAAGLTVPSPLLKGITLLGEASIPVLMVILGMQLERTRVAGAPASLTAATVLRLAVAPCIAWGLTAAFGYQGLERKVLILQTSTPAAVLPLLYAMRFKCRPDWIASNLLVSTLASAVSLSVVLALLL
ncbi:MAG: AEC family transporter [Deltaproteobacteria bacterium]|nr:AEC family transporter [Deltaproteobacteria bacterium]